MPYADPTAINATGITDETRVNVTWKIDMSPIVQLVDITTVISGRRVPSIVLKLK